MEEPLIITTPFKLTEASERNQHNSPFLGVLPAELRNRIYLLVLGNKTWTVRWKATSNDPEKNAFSLLLASRQLHAETRLLPVRLSKFCFSEWYFFEAWLRRLTWDQQRAVASIEFRFDVKALRRVEGHRWIPGSVDRLEMLSWWNREALRFEVLPGLRRVRLVMEGDVRGMGEKAGVVWEELRGVVESVNREGRARLEMVVDEYDDYAELELQDGFPPIGLFD
ncbi:hypothetical protein K458DRAFT_433995 [Lentithecium fluviatile CBS 122367]|uniref:Uncharacterized protein n=1 Tax=Lentithecium fluviatile CBS 122367 TaxID=1168545 RepID=A0A6G1ISC2_9PLEO|nr:hypothetical protein K458DRAFT_433995 [Lentithecium fluviatile CBS 122367]